MVSPLEMCIWMSLPYLMVISEYESAIAYTKYIVPVSVVSYSKVIYSSLEYSGIEYGGSFTFECIVYDIK